ncbi:MAG: DUF6171 family protein [Huintestinicola sp.]
MKIICRKCLISDMSPDEYLTGLKEYIASVPAEKRADYDVYSRRLEICRACEKLVNGMCAECGCYVELRALKPHMYCASSEKKW